MTSPDESSNPDHHVGGPDGVPDSVLRDPQPSAIGAWDAPGPFVPPAQPGFDGTPGENDEVGEEPRRRVKRSTVLLGTFAVLATAIIVAMAFIRVPYYRYSPGTLYGTVPLITIDGQTTYRDDGGAIDFTTVSSKKASVLEYELAHFDPAVELIPAELIDGDKPPEQTRQINLEMMADSKQQAEVVALRKLGYPVEVLGTGGLIRGVGKGTPAEKVLHANDTIVEVDGQPVALGEEVVKAIGSHKPGDEITLKIEPPPGQGDPRTEKVVLAARDTDPNKALLGVDLGTRNTRFKLPFTITVDTKDIGGPSAGLGITLGIIDVLTPGSLTGGKHVAVTGTIDLNGGVGPIGGVQQKTFLAERNGVDLFLVPKAEADEARKFAGSMKVVGVDNLDEALAAIEEAGGNTDIVEQTAAGQPGTTPR